MGNVVVSGYVSGPVVSWGYVGTTVSGGDSALYYYMNHPVKKDKRTLLIQVKKLLETLKGA
jgi:hypothetical protein